MYFIIIEFLLYSKVAVYYEDHGRIQRNFLENSTVKVQITTDVAFPNGKLTSEIEINGSDEDDNFSTNFYNSLIKKTLRDQFLESSIVPYSFDVPKGTSHVELKAYFDCNGKVVEDRMHVIKKNLPEEKYIDVWTTSENLAVGEDAVFHVKVNFEVETFYTLVRYCNLFVSILLLCFYVTMVCRLWLKGWYCNLKSTGLRRVHSLRLHFPNLPHQKWLHCFILSHIVCRKKMQQF